MMLSREKKRKKDEDDVSNCSRLMFLERVRINFKAVDLKYEKKEGKKFHIHKNRPNFAAALLLKLVCNKEEAVLDKEQKLLKIFGKNDVQSDNYNMQSHNLYLHAAGLMGGSFEQAQGQTDGMPPRFLGSPRRQTVVERLNNDSIKCVGKVGLVKPPHIVAPLTVEPTKHRLCGALVCEITPKIERLTRTQPPRLIFIHEGVNNVSKSFLINNEFNQLLSTTQQFEHLAQMLQCTLESDRHVSIVLSLIIMCKDEAINARSTIINENLCKRNCWMFMENSNINCRHLRDCVHLNEEGQSIFLNNLYDVFKNVL
ncbi:unnamed protein product [Mytilus coruscus]|uniref:Uncharacterized protein n=1 Tax=Mytilus coruscus TaxID=42192 RepID=A0A6J8B346_MYTCO|nr:unnamed protein product [Mytilus coruscus]